MEITTKFNIGDSRMKTIEKPKQPFRIYVSTSQTTKGSYPAPVPVIIDKVKQQLTFPQCLMVEFMCGEFTAGCIAQVHRRIELLMSCDVVLQLPDWKNSKDSVLENEVAVIYNKPIFRTDSPDEAIYYIVNQVKKLHP